jgi:hypothetical protein
MTPQSSKGSDHVFPTDEGPFIPSEADLERARALSADACPRRYCFHWDSNAFHWERTPKEGCLFLVGEKPGWKYAGIPCCRSDPTSVVDHYEPNDLYAEADGMDLTKWEEKRMENDRIVRALEREREGQAEKSDEDGTEEA